MAQQSQVEILDSSSSSSTNEQSQLSFSDSSLSRNSSFSRLNAQAPEFVPTRNPSTQSKPQPPQLQVRPAMIHSPHHHPHIYSPHGTGAFHVAIQNHVIPVHQQQLHVPVQNYHHHHWNHNQNHNHHRHQNNHSHNNHLRNNSNNNLHHYEDQQEVEVPVKVDHKEKKSDESILKILNQVEYYFSDLNLATTDHLIKFILKDPEGYVPISVVASFKKIKALTSSNSQLASVLQKSSKLVVSEDGKKVKRQNPLTESELEELQSRIVVAENLPEDHCHQNLMQLFSAVGSVKNIRTCLPQTSGGGASSASRSAKADGMLFSNKLHAFVEYESVELAEKAIAELNNEANWRSGLRVRLMLRRGSKTAQARGKNGHDGHEGEWQFEEEDASISEQHSSEQQSEDSSQQHDVHSHEHIGEEHYNEKDGGHKKGRNKGRDKGRGWGDRGQYHHNNQGDRGQYHHNNHNSSGHHAGLPPSNSMVNNDQPTIGKQPPGPQMPDGTRGFSMGRGKPVSVNTA